MKSGKASEVNISRKTQKQLLKNSLKFKFPTLQKQAYHKIHVKTLTAQFKTTLKLKGFSKKFDSAKKYKITYFPFT